MDGILGYTPIDKPPVAGILGRAAKRENASMEKVRVKIMDGLGEESLGLGWLVGFTTVYAFWHPDRLMISTLPDPTQKPTDDEVALMESDGFQLTQLDDNPVIELDSGETVYGSQVWWEKA